MNFRHVKCAVNPKLGRERSSGNPKHNGQGRTVAIIGGGPAGIEAAFFWIDVDFMLYSSIRTFTGGTLNIADKGEGKEKITQAGRCSPCP